jgi:membrane-associated phospholipid phosphatase
MSRAYAAILLVPLVAAVAILLSGTNVPVFQALQQGSRVVPDGLFAAFWESATYAGDGLAVFALATALLLQRPYAAWAGVVAAVPGTLLLHGLKALVPYDRPALVLMNDGVTVLGPALHHGSFPSGHSVAAGILAGILFLAYRHWAVRVLGVVVALLIGISRAAVGVHWPIDIATGLALGWLSAWIGWQLVADAPWVRSAESRVVGALVLGGCAVGLWFHPMGLPAATPFRIALALTGLVLALLALRRGVQDWRVTRGRAPGP